MIPRTVRALQTLTLSGGCALLVKVRCLQLYLVGHGDDGASEGRYGIPLRNIFRKYFKYEVAYAAREEVVGLQWDDAFYTGIYKICLTHNDIAIGSFQVVYYDLNDQEIFGNKHMHDGAGNDFPHPVEIQLFAGESIVKVTGHTSLIENIKVVRLLTFSTNHGREFGPFPPENKRVIEGTPFNLPIEGGRKVVGFKGVTDKFLNAIGVHSTTE
ncbi:hypothetical protein TIFTF001_039011 [Ficus carica]|uniref:Jacalin-type lectin domain-containing protein n=1 Tax=Ficus carica TaxID=3494 RepID=A0AA88JFD3_FICCA|nr:hypothetical protein TIFTF001_039011 [Ficus carica]